MVINASVQSWIPVLLWVLTQLPNGAVFAQATVPGTPPAELESFLLSDNFHSERDSIQVRRVKTLSKYRYRGSASAHVDADSMEWEQRFTFDDKGQCILFNGRGEATRRYDYSSNGAEKKITVIRRNKSEGEDLWNRRFDEQGRLTEAMVRIPHHRTGWLKGKNEVWRVEKDKNGRVKAEFYKGLKIKDYEFSPKGTLRVVRHFKADKQTPPSAELLTLEEFDSCGMIAAVTVVNADTTRAGSLQLQRTPVLWRQKPDSCPCNRRRQYGFIASGDTILMPGKRKITTQEIRSNGHRVENVEVSTRLGKILELETKEFDDRDSIKSSLFQLFNGKGQLIEVKQLDRNKLVKHEKIYYFPLGLRERVDILDENGVVSESEIFVLRYYPKVRR
ncbi:MAG: hypothetical protein RL757_1080 [Bacteroidota bacterium]|jgi:hypothetical protein